MSNDGTKYLKSGFCDEIPEFVSLGQPALHLDLTNVSFGLGSSRVSFGLGKNRVALLSVSGVIRVCNISHSFV